MPESLEKSPPMYREGLFSAISVGFFFILVGTIFATTPNLFDEILAFFRDFGLVAVPRLGFSLPAPRSPSDHLVFYSAVHRFSFAMGLFQVTILALRAFVRSPWSKREETVGNLVFWMGTGFLTQIFLNPTTTRITWFVFWSTIIMLIGVSLIARAFVLAVRIYSS